MNTFGRIIGAGLLLTLAAPAFCDAPDGLIGQWQDPAHSNAVILDFRTDGTQHSLARTDGKLVPLRQKDGSEMVVKYTVKGDQLEFTSLDGKHSEEHSFKLEGDTLTFLPSGKFHNASTLDRILPAAPAAPTEAPAPTSPGQ